MEKFETVKEKVKHREASKSEKVRYYSETLTAWGLIIVAVGLLLFALYLNGYFDPAVVQVN